MTAAKGANPATSTEVPLSVITQARATGSTTLASCSLTTGRQCQWHWHVKLEVLGGLQLSASGPGLWRDLWLAQVVAFK